MVHTPSDRVQVRELGQLRSPGTCALCGNGTCLEGYVDLDIYYEWEGQVYLCMNCARQVAQVVGALLPDQAEFLQATLEKVQTELTLTKAELSHANEQLSAYGTLFGSITPSGSPPASDASEESPEQSGDAVDAPSASDAGESEPPKSVKGRRSPNAASPTAGNRSDTIAL